MVRLQLQFHVLRYIVQAVSPFSVHRIGNFTVRILRKSNAEDLPPRLFESNQTRPRSAESNGSTESRCRLRRSPCLADMWP